MTPPFATQVLASLAPWLANDPQGVLSNLATAYATIGEQVFDIVQDVGSSDQPSGFTAGWSTLLDPDNCPAAFIPYGAQFVGVQIPTGTDTADARALWKSLPGFQRGTVAAIVAAAGRFMTNGTAGVTLQERENQSGANAYSFILIVSPTADVISVSGLTAAVNAVKPAGITWTLVQTNGWTISLMEASQATIGALEAAFVTIAGLENDQPGT